MNKEYSYKGYFMAAGGYIIWGFSPLVYQLAKEVPSTQIVLHRLVWCFFFAVVFACILYRRNFFQKVFNKKFSLSFVLSGILIASHWLLFNFAISSRAVIDASLGYFLMPLINSLLGWIFFKEKPDNFQRIAILLGILAFAWLVFKLNKIPWLSLSIALTFAFYGLVKKKNSIEPLIALINETTFLMPFCLIYWIWLGYHHQSAMNFYDLKMFFILIFLGLWTVLPLLLFASSTKYLTLTALGFMLYISKSMQFLIAVFILKEPLDTTKLIAFIIIWIALIIFSIGAFKNNKHLSRVH